MLHLLIWRNLEWLDVMNLPCSAFFCVSSDFYQLADCDAPCLSYPDYCQQECQEINELDCSTVDYRSGDIRTYRWEQGRWLVPMQYDGLLVNGHAIAQNHIHVAHMLLPAIPSMNQGHQIGQYVTKSALSGHQQQRDVGDLHRQGYYSGDKQTSHVEWGHMRVPKKHDEHTQGGPSTLTVHGLYDAYKPSISNRHPRPLICQRASRTFQLLQMVYTWGARRTSCVRLAAPQGVSAPLRHFLARYRTIRRQIWQVICTVRARLWVSCAISTAWGVA